MKKLFYSLILIISLMSCESVDHRDIKVDKSKLFGNDFRLFQNTPAWALAKAVDDNDVEKIKQLIIKNKRLLKFRESRFGKILLILAVENEKYESVKRLVELGADSNIQDTYDGISALMEAAHIGGGFLDRKTDSRFLKLLLRYGGNPNIEEKGTRPQGNYTRKTPLIIACSQGVFEYVSILIEAGANVNYTNEFGETPLYSALTSDSPDIVMYLLEKGADYRRVMYLDKNGEKRYISDVIKYWHFEKGSQKFQKQSEIMSFLKKNGVVM